VTPAERQLIRMLAEANGFRETLARELAAGALYRGLDTERIFETLISKAAEDPDPAALSGGLDARDRRLFFDVLFESSPEPTWEAAESCLEVLRSRRIASELTELEGKIRSNPAREELVGLLRRKRELQLELARKQGAA
jgi:hypothetical protein